MTKDWEDPASGDFTRRDFLVGGLAAAAVAGGGLGAFYFGYDQSLGDPLRVGVIGTGDEGSVLIGALNPKFLQVQAIADVRPYNVHRAFHGEYGQAARPGLLSVYGWSGETEARQHVKVYGHYVDLLNNAQADGIEAVIIALPLHLHAPCAIAAMKRGLHVLTEKLMGHSVHECKEMGRVAKQTGLHLATGHQRHYNILYAQATERIRRGLLGDLHYIRAQWHRSNLPGKDSWQQPLPPGIRQEKTNKLLDDLKKYREQLKKARGQEIEQLQKQIRQVAAQIADKVLQLEDAKVLEPIRGTAAFETAQTMMALRGTAGKPPAEALGYKNMQIKNGSGSVVYDYPAIEELIRWRLFERTGGGLMAELGSHQLDAASIFIQAAHGTGEKVHPLSVTAASARSLFPPDRDAEDHVLCILEFPGRDYRSDDPHYGRKKIGVMYSSINGNGFGGYGEIVFGTKGTLILEREQVLHEPSSATQIKVSAGAAGPTLDTQASGPARELKSSGEQKVSRGYAEELEHWAWCIRNPALQNKPRCHPEVALGDAVIALVTNVAAREGKRIDFKPEWFKIDSDQTPEGVKPDVSRYTE